MMIASIIRSSVQLVQYPQDKSHGGKPPDWRRRPALAGMGQLLIQAFVVAAVADPLQLSQGCLQSAVVWKNESG